MKKAILSIVGVALLSALVLSSCQKDHDTVSLKATINTYLPTGKDAKTYIDNNRYVNWSSDAQNTDKVNINGTDYTVSVTGTGNDRVATIAGVTVPSGDYFAYYPAGRVLTNNASGWPQVLLPQVQNYRTDASGTHQIVEAPMAAWCTQSTHALNFTNLCALLKIELPSSFDISQNEVAYIRVSSTNKPLWGKATITGTTTPTLSEPSLANLNTTDNSVTLDFTNNGLHGSDGNSSTSTSGAASGVRSRGPFYIVLPPVDDVSGLTVDVYVFYSTANNNRRTVHLYSKTRTTSISIVSNLMYNTGGNLPTTYIEVPDVPYPNLGSGEFSVGRNKKVRFALGNLQYQASTGTWRFAEHQWTAIGNALGNTAYANNRSTQSKWIDLFGYGTSGVNYQPWLSSTTPGDYPSRNIANTVNDWGVNEISNGGNQPNKWRTLTRDEWYYLLNSRSGSDNLHKPVVRVNNILGTIIFPDNCTIPSPYNDYSGLDWRNGITIAQFQELADVGAIFLPVTGYRSGRTVYNHQTATTYQGRYWTSQWNPGYYEKPYTIQFDSYGDNFISDYDRFLGQAVRLVRDVN